MKHLKCLLLCSLLGSASMQAAASCYTVYDPSGVVYHESTAPVDMSRPLHETMPARFPGGHMIFDTDTDCCARHRDCHDAQPVISAADRSADGAGYETALCDAGKRDGPGLDRPQG